MPGNLKGKVVRLDRVKRGDLVALTTPMLWGNPKTRWYRVVPQDTIIGEHENVRLMVARLPELRPDQPVVVCADRRRKKGTMVQTFDKKRAELLIALEKDPR